MYRVKDQNGKTKYSGRSKATVLDNRDPLNRGRIIVDHPVTGPTTWIQYLRSPGHFTVPSIGDVVYLESDSGQVEYPVAWGNIISGPDNAPNMPEEFRRDIPTNRGIYTPGGHLLEFDDGEATLSSDISDTNFTTKSRGVRLTTTAGNTIHISEDSENNIENITIKDKNGNFILLDHANGSNNVKISSEGTSEVVTTEDRTEIVTGGNLTSSVPEGEINVDAKDGIKYKMKEGKIAIGTDSVELLQQIVDALDDLSTLFGIVALHNHIGNLGYVTAPPDTQADWDASSAEMAAIKAKIESIKASF